MCGLPTRERGGYIGTISLGFDGKGTCERVKRKAGPPGSLPGRLRTNS